MENTIISIILLFNIGLMLLYFVVKINQRAINRARGIANKEIDDSKDLIITDEDHQWIKSFISDPSIPDTLKEKPTFTFDLYNVNLRFINRGEIDKNVNGFGVIIRSTADNLGINLIPISFLEKTRKGSLYLQNKDRNLIGLFTPYHIVIFNSRTFEFTQSVEEESAKETEDIPMASYTKDNQVNEHFIVKVKLPFLDPTQFIEKYYRHEFIDYKKSR